MGTSCGKTVAQPGSQAGQPIPSENVSRTFKAETPSVSPVKNAADEVEITFPLCRLDDLKDNELREMNVEDFRVLVVKEKGQIRALGNKCPHYGAPLSKGIVCDGKVYCPWHLAAFSTHTGDMEDFPALDPIPSFNVVVDETTQLVKIQASRVALAQDKITKPLTKRDPANEVTIVIIGGGGAGFSCAQTLRQNGFDGRVILVTKEASTPYDRPKLSKVMHMDAQKLQLKPEDFYKMADIEVLKNTEAASVETANKCVVLKDGTTITYSYLVVATGGRPRPLPVPGTHLTNVFLLRTPEDANRIVEAAEGKKVVVVGTSFIGMESAAYLKSKAESVTVIGRSTPFQYSLGPMIGQRFQRLFEEKGVEFIISAEVVDLQGNEEGELTEVILNTGQTLPADVLIAGLGVIPATECLRGSDVALDAKGFVPVDQEFRTNIPEVFAVGDIASFPIEGEGSRQVSVGHWQVALTHGRAAALALLGVKPNVQKHVPFFWSQMFGKSIRFVGHADKFDDVVIHGDLEQLTFAAYYCLGDHVLALATLNMDPLTAQFAALLNRGVVLHKNDIQESETHRNWIQLLN